jgi:hypothetical protein
LLPVEEDYSAVDDKAEAAEECGGFKNTRTTGYDVLK